MLHKKLRLIGYVRTAGTDLSEQQQQQMIREYCEKHHHNLVEFAPTDHELPSFGWAEAKLDLKKFDGVVAVDLNRFVTHACDRLNDLRILLKGFAKKGKVVVGIIDGIDTQTAHGQEAAFELTNEWSDREAVSLPTRSDFESLTPGNA